MAAASAMPLRYVCAEDKIRDDIPAVTLDGKQIVLMHGDLEDLRAGLQGVMLLPEQEGYDHYRLLWNGMFDKPPALIVRVAGTGGELRPWPGIIDRSALRRTQLFRKVGLRRWLDDRSDPDERGRCGSGGAYRAYRWRRIAGGDGSRDPGIRSCHHRRDYLPYRGRGPDPGRRLRQDVAQVPTGL